jgi:hypothetical protein
MLKTFDDLVFNPHRAGVGTHAELNFQNGYGVSVIFGSHFYSDGVSTYEVAIRHGKSLCYRTPITSDVIGWQSKSEVTDIMQRVQELPSNELCTHERSPWEE